MCAPVHAGDQGEQQGTYTARAYVCVCVCVCVCASLNFCVFVCERWCLHHSGRVC